MCLAAHGSSSQQPDACSPFHAADALAPIQYSHVPQVEHMGWQEAGSVARHAQALSAALDDLKRFPPPEAALQTAYFVEKARAALVHLLHVAGVRADVLHSLATVGDFGYAWGILQTHTARLQALVRDLRGRSLACW